AQDAAGGRARAGPVDAADRDGAARRPAAADAGCDYLALGTGSLLLVGVEVAPTRLLGNVELMHRLRLLAHDPHQRVLGVARMLQRLAALGGEPHEGHLETVDHERLADRPRVEGVDAVHEVALDRRHEEVVAAGLDRAKTALEAL